MIQRSSFPLSLVVSQFSILFQSSVNCYMIQLVWCIFMPVLHLWVHSKVREVCNTLFSWIFSVSYDCILTTNSMLRSKIVQLQNGDLHRRTERHQSKFSQYNALMAAVILKLWCWSIAHIPPQSTTKSFKKKISCWPLVHPAALSCWSILNRFWRARSVMMLIITAGETHSSASLGVSLFNRQQELKYPSCVKVKDLFLCCQYFDNFDQYICDDVINCWQHISKQ